MPIYTPGKVTLAKGQPVPNDPNFAFNSLLLHGNGTNGSTVITDSSGSPKTVTAVGNAQISTAQSKFGGASIAFDGTGDWLRIANGSWFNFNADFTLECWFYQLSSKVASIFSLAPAAGSGFGIGPSPSGGGTLWFWNNTAQIQTSSVFSYNTWNHFAAVRTANVASLYLNGVSVGSYTESKTFLSTSDMYIGGDEFSQSFNGYIDDLRITKGVARYTATFTPPTAPFPDF